MWEAFKRFAARGNVIDLAVGVIVGASFGKIVNTLVDGVLMPPLGMVLKHVDFSNLFVALDRSRTTPHSLAEAKAAGIPVIAYGQLITDTVSFLIVALVVFLIVHEFHKFIDRPQPTNTTKTCPYCLTVIPLKASRCPACTSAVAEAGQ
jgi:large conductance mechanosensitive channel